MCRGRPGEPRTGRKRGTIRAETDRAGSGSLRVPAEKAGPDSRLQVAASGSQAEALVDQPRNVLDALGYGDAGRLHARNLVGRGVGLALDDGAGVSEAHARHLVHEAA